MRQHLGTFVKDIARGLGLRHDHGSQSTSDAFQGEPRFLGTERAPAFIGAPEGNGCAGRFIPTLQENRPRVRTFDTLEELRLALPAFRDAHNTTGPVERHGSRHPPPSASDTFQPAALAA